MVLFKIITKNKKAMQKQKIFNLTPHQIDEECLQHFGRGAKDVKLSEFITKLMKGKIKK